MKIGILSLVLSFCFASFAVADLTATYIVPPTKTEAAKTYVLKNTVISKNQNGSRVIRFDLPEDLVGNNAPTFILTEGLSDVNFSRFTDGATSVSCAESDKLLNCVVKYNEHYNQLINIEQTANFLKRKFEKKPELLKQKLIDAKSFSTDPEGVLVINL